MLRLGTRNVHWKAGTDEIRVEGMKRLNAYLRHTQKSLNEMAAGGNDVNSRPVHVVIGNEAADADSIVSSLVYAHHLHILQKINKTLYIPVLSIPRAELALRCDVRSLMQAMDVDLSALVFVNEFPWLHPSIASALRLTLVDHNALNTKRIDPDLPADKVGEVVEIIDHHMDLGLHQTTVNAREIAFSNGQALVASCCTMIAERLLTETYVDGVHATLLLSVIALDSINFSPSAKKVTPRDLSAAQRLQPYAFAQASELFEWLQAEKFSVTHWNSFTLQNCLQCDYKEFDIPGKKAKYGVSSILISLCQLMEKASSINALNAALQSYCRENNLVFLVIMTMYLDGLGERHREILFYEEGEPTITTQCLEHLQEHNILHLIPKEGESNQIRMYRQGNTMASRKQVVPLLQEALSAQLPTSTL